MRAIPPIVSTDWLEENIDDPKFVIIDIRINEEYKAGHIPYTINIPFPDAINNPCSDWFVERDGLLLELPEEADLFNTLGSAGIRGDSVVVVINKTDEAHPLADAARVADTLIYAGIVNVAILDGGYNKLIAEERPVSLADIKRAPAAYIGKTDKTMFVSKEYVQNNIGKCVIIDAREPDRYFGVSKMASYGKAGHIPTAKCLPASWIWTEEGTYRTIDELREIACGVIGRNISKEIIVYCGLGGFSSPWWFVLKEVLGYTNVKIYGGAAQQWTRDPEAPVVIYKWE